MADLIVKLDRQAYSAVGRCVYCGSNGGSKGLRDEHIIPFALGGNVVLRKATCSDCEAVISYLEGYVGRVIFGSLRSYHQIQKRKRRQPPATATMTFDNDSGTEARKILLTDMPPVLMMLEFQEPGILSGRLPGAVAPKGQAWIWYSLEFREKVERLRQPGDKGWSVHLSFKEDVFSRFIAKVAHCLAIAQFGWGTFRPALQSIILGTEPNIGFLVGGSAPPTEPDPPCPKERHEVSAHEFAFGQMANDVTGDRLLFADMRLFAFTGSPTYRAIVGEPGQALVEQLS